MGAPRKATHRISGRVEDGALYLSVEGHGERHWRLAGEQDRARTDEVARAATAWADDCVQVTIGQRKYIRKVLSEAGYLVRPARRLSPT